MTIPKSPSSLLNTAGGSCVLALLGMAIAFLHASVFDYRFGFAALGACVMGLAVGVATTRCLPKKPTVRKTGVWFALAGFIAAINACTFFIVPLGSAGTYLCVTGLAALPFAFWVTGLILLKQEQNIPNQWFLGVMVLGAGIGIIISFYFATQSSRGPLFMVWLAAGGLIFLTMTTQIRIITLVISSLSLILLGVTGSFNGWNFKAPPHWTSGDGQFDKPFYAEATLNNSFVSLATQWDTLARTDVAYKKTDAGLVLVFKNGVLTGLLPFDRSKNVNSDQFKKDFPLVALPLLAGQPHDILLINSGAGLEIKMAVDFGVSRIHDMENNFALKAIVEQHQEIYGPLINNPNIKLTYGNVRNALRKDNAIYDQIYLTIPQNKVPGWTEPGMSENYLYTKEAFRNYWARLKPGGMLVLLAGEEMLYMRALLVAWETLDEDRAGGNALLGSQAWGYRMVTLTPPVRPYYYLLMLVKGPIGDETASRIEQEARNMIVEKLFGPGMLPPAAAFSIRSHPYYILYHPKGPAIAQEALSEYMSWRLKARVSLDTPTDRHPDFFQIVDDMQPFLKWLVAICSALLIYIYLFPLGAERRLDNPTNDIRPPLPVHLSYYLALSAGTMMALVALTSQATLFTERADDTLTAVMTAVLLGAGTAALFRRHGNDAHRQWRVAALALAVVVLSSLLYWILANAWEIVGEWPVLPRLVAVAVMVFPLGLFTAQLLLQGLEHLQRNLPALVPWAMIMYGLAAPVGAIAAFWICQHWGWGIVWAFVAGCYLVVLGTGVYLRWPGVHGETKQAPAPS